MAARGILPVGRNARLLSVQRAFEISDRTAYAKAWLYQHMSERDGTGA